MPYLIGPKTADWLANAMRGNADLRSRRKLPRWSWLPPGEGGEVPTGDIPPAGGGEEGPDGYGLTVSIDVVVEMAYDSATHKFSYKTRKMSFSRGRLVQIDPAVATDVFTAVRESY
jgi:hypothetical protein